MESTIIDNPSARNNTSNAANDFEYLTSEEFSGESFKLEVKNLPRYYGVREFRDFLVEELMLQVTKFKRPRTKCQYAFICLKSEEERTRALSVLNEAIFKKRRLKACLAKPCADPLIRKRQYAEQVTEGPTEKVAKLNEKPGLTPAEIVRDATTPLWNMPYDEQLKLKQNNMKGLLKSFHNRIMDKLNPVLNNKKWAKKRFEEFGGLICPIQEIEKSNTIGGYRNKCEFTIGINSISGERSVGFRLGKYADGLIDVGPIDNLCHIPESMKNIVKSFEIFVRNSKLDVFSPYLNKGHLKQLTVRCSSNGIMLIVLLHPQCLTEGEIIEFQNELIDFFFKENKESGDVAKVTSLYIEFYKRKSDSIEASFNNMPTLLSGSPFIAESLLGLRFRISPQSFFQVNNLGAETLYQLIMRLAGLERPSNNVVIVDVCCGTGTIGLCTAKYCKKVYGLEYCEAAVSDAIENAKLNNIENCLFIQGKAEKTLPTLLHELGENDEIIAIVDPPRAGLAKSVITSLRQQRKVRKIIYVSCNPIQASNNFDALCKRPTKEVGGVPFVPSVWAPVDMFPYTEHCELVVLFDRFDTVSE